MRNPSTTDRADRSAPARIYWRNLLTVLSAAILIGTEVFGVAYAGGWAVSEFLGLRYYLGDNAPYVVQALFCALGISVMVQFMRLAVRREPFLRRD
jgi:hypothetical protein